jgi:hypothetical protein
MKLGEHDYWPPRWGVLPKQEEQDLLHMRPDFFQRARLSEVLDLLEPGVAEPRVVTINVIYPDYQGSIPGDLWVKDKLSQHHLFEWLQGRRGMTIAELAEANFDSADLSRATR